MAKPAHVRKKNCGNCEHYGDEKIDDHRSGKVVSTCRGALPKLPDEAFGNLGRFPMMPADEWCAKHVAIAYTAVSLEFGDPADQPQP